MRKQKIRKLFSDHNVVSLGYSCYPKAFIKTFRKCETNFFDWIGAPPWSIRNALQSEFKDALNKAYIIDCDFSYIGIKRDDNLGILKRKGKVHKLYFFRFMHDNFRDFDLLKAKYERRIARFYDLLKSDDKLLFIHLEESNDRIFDALYDEVRQYYPPSKDNYSKMQHELGKKYVNEISDLIKNKFNKDNFKILYFSPSINEIKQENNIVFMHIDPKILTIHYSKAHNLFYDAILENYQYLQDIL